MAVSNQRMEVTMTKPNEALTVPWGVDAHGALCSPEDADRREEWWCPNCKRPLILRRGEIRRAHFAHCPHAPWVECSEESLLHKTAKALICQTLNAAIHGRGAPPVVVRACLRCRVEDVTPMPATRFEAAREEVAVASGHVVDVALMEGGAVAAAIEVFATHAVDPDKQAALGKIDLPWCEVEAEAIVEEPHVWRPIASSRDHHCAKCAVEMQAEQAALERERKERAAKKASLARLANELNVPVAQPPYRMAVCRCYRCRGETLVYTWSDFQMHSQVPPPEPRPRTLQWRKSKGEGDPYWANVCARCSARFADYYLHDAPDAPFLR